MIGLHGLLQRLRYTDQCRQMDDSITAGHCSLDCGTIGHISFVQINVRRQIGKGPGGEIVEHAHCVPSLPCCIDGVRTNETSATCHKNVHGKD